MNRHLRWLCLMGCAALPVQAQHDMSHMNGMAGAMPSLPLGLPWSRIGSGTSWLPDSSPRYMAHRNAGSWMLMLHGAAAVQYDDQSTLHGDTQVGLVDWEMLMAARSAAGGVLRFNLMTSLEPFVIGPRGYPQLLQSGESYRGARLANIQHPHDLITELAAVYEHSLIPKVAGFVYAAAAGEPALGPVAYMHRPSAEVDPMAPLGHHWQDATHETVGVVTAGLYGRWLKLEGSAFNGREPDGYRFNLDVQHARLDSYSGRVTLAPTGRVTASAWGGYIFDHDPLDPGTGMQRYGASLATAMRGVSGGDWSTAAVWGLNVHHHGSREHIHDPNATPKTYHVSSAGLIESTLGVGRRTELYARLEEAQKSADDLGFLGGDLSQTFTVRSAAVGATRDLRSAGDATFAIGGRLALNYVPETLHLVYRTRTPMGLDLFVRVRPRRTKE